MSGSARRGVIGLVVATSVTVAALAGAGPAAAGPLFNAGPASSLPGFAQQMVSADFNGDGYFDVATTDYANGAVDVELGSSNGTFTAAPGSPISLGQGVGPIATGEFGGDTHTDLIVGNETQDTVTVLQDDGSGIFTPQTPISLPGGCSPMAIATGDFNGDLVEDFAVADSCGEVDVYLGNPSGGFSATATTVSLPTLGCKATYLDGIVAGSFGAGSGLDLAVLDGYNNEVDVLSNNGHGAFSTTAADDTPTGVTTECSSSVDFVGAESLAEGPFGGSLSDLAIGYQFDGDAQILLGKGAGKFTVGAPTQIAPGYTSITNIAQGNFVGAEPGIATSDYWQGGGPGSTSLADWVSVANVGVGATLTPVSGSPYELQGLIGALTTGAFADALQPPQAGDDLVINDGEGYQG